MNLDFSDDQKFLQEEARKFLEKEEALNRNRAVLETDNKFDEDLKWYVDCEWYNKLLFSTYSQQLEILFFKDSRIISNQTKNSITYKIRKKLEKIKKYEIKKLKKKKLIPNNYIGILQKIISLLITFDSKIIRIINVRNLLT